MKKSIKILSLVLALAIICGALVIGVFAKVATAAAGIQVLKAADIESATVGTTIKGTDGTDSSKSSTIGGLPGNILGRYGIYSIQQNAYDGNKYLQIANGAYQGKSGPYVGSGYKTIGNMIDVNNAKTYSYQVVDLDVTFPTNVSPSFTVRMEQRGYKAANNGGSTGSAGGPAFQIWSEDKADDKNVYIKESLVGGETFTISATEWTHVTFIVECVKTGKLADGTDANGSADEMVDMYAYLAINGKIVDKVAYGNQKTRWGEYNFCFSEIRMNTNAYYADTSNLANSSIALDNFSWWSINPTAYDATKLAELKGVLATGEGASLSAWSDSLYDASTMPFGKLVATIGEGESIKYFDNMNEAFATAQDGDTITLMSDVYQLITVDKAITVKKNGYTANLINDGVKMTETEDEYKFESTTVKMTVRMQACKCGCTEAKTITVFDGANIWEAIVAEYGKEPKCSYSVGATQYAFDGFTVAGTAANLVVDANGKFDTTKVVDSTLANKVATLTVSYIEKAPIAQVLRPDGTVYEYFYPGASFQSLLTSVEKVSGKLVLLADFSTEGTGAYHKYLGKSVVIDVNGYALKHLTAVDDPSKTNENSYSLFIVNAATVKVTVTSSVEGGKIFSAACYKASNRFASPLMSINANGGTAEIIGQVDGKTTLSYYGATAIQSYNKQGKVNVDGGYFIKNRGDNQGMFEMRAQSDCSFKNMEVDGATFSVFAFNAQTQHMGATTAKVTIDNCRIYNASTVIYRLGDPVTVTITNTVLGSNVNPGVDGAAVAPSGKNVTIGKGCKLADGITFADCVGFDGAPADVAETLTYKAMVNDWTVGEDNFALTEKTTSVVISKAIVDTFNVEFTQGGNTVHTAKVYAGMTANVPMGAVEGTKGMVNYVKAVAVPADAKEGDKIEIPADAPISYVAGKVPVQFSISLTGHTTYNFFLPIVEGITYDAKAALTHNLTGYSPARPAVSTYGVDAAGEKWMKINTWPGMYLLDEVGSIVIKYSYEGTDLTYTIDSFGAIDYCEYILKNSNVDELKAVVANALYTANKYDAIKGSRVTERMTQVLASDAFNAAFELVEAPTDATNKTAYEKMAEDGYVKEIALIATSKNTGLTVGIKKNGDYGFKMVPKNATKFSANLVGEIRTDNSEYFFMHNIRSYAFNEVFTIEVYETYTPNVDGNGNETSIKAWGGAPIATYEWTLAGYINDNAETLTADQLAYAKAMYSYAETSCEYLQWKKDNGFDMFS